MDDVVNRLARELAEAISSVVTVDPKVEACREKARAAGYEMRVSLEAIVGFGCVTNSKAITKISVTSQPGERSQKMSMSANDRLFLRSLRIAADEISEKVE